MLKKLGVLGIVLVLLFSLVGCEFPENLESYKETAKKTIEAYAYEKIIDNDYSELGLAAIDKAVTDGKAAVDAATSKPVVDTAVNDAKEAMDEVAKSLKLNQGLYATDDKVYLLRLHDENQFSLHTSYMSHLPTGTYRVENKKLTLEYLTADELVFEIKSGELIFIGTIKDGVTVEEGIVKVGTIFRKTFVEVETTEMVKLHTWTFTSGVPNNAIVFKHSDENAQFECATDKGQFGFGSDGGQSLIAKSGDTIHWSHTEFVEQAFVSIIVKIDDEIVGYAVVKVLINNGPADHKAEILKSVEFQKANDGFQTITIEQIQATINQIIKNNGGNTHEN
jgi:hypothetical protein